MAVKAQTGGVAGNGTGSNGDTIVSQGSAPGSDDGGLNTAIGWDSSANGGGATAIGRSIHVNGNQSTGLGYKVTVDGAGATAVGSTARASESSSAFGFQATATGDKSIALGRESISTGVQSIAIGSSKGGNKTKASADKAIALGASAVASAIDTLAIGVDANASANEAMAIGVNSKALQHDTLAIGGNTFAKNNNSIAIGSKSQSVGDSSTSIGVESVAFQTTGLALGFKAVSGNGDVKVKGPDGSYAVSSKGAGAVAIGARSHAVDNFTTALGDSAQALMQNDTAVGKNAYVGGKGDSVALGYESIAFGQNTLALGAWAKAGDGNKTNKNIDRATAIGSNTEAKANSSTAVGARSITSGEATGILGYQSTATAERAFVLGSNATATAAKGVAIGSYSNADRVATNAGVYLAGEGTVNTTTDHMQGAVSVGGNYNGTVYKRQIINVAAGAADTDAVNVAQLKAVADNPLTFAGDSGTPFTRKLGETTNVKGGATGALSDNNIGVVAGTDTLTVKLAKTLNGLDAVNATDINATTVTASDVNSTNVTATNKITAPTVETDTLTTTDGLSSVDVSNIATKDELAAAGREVDVIADPNNNANGGLTVTKKNDPIANKDTFTVSFDSAKIGEEIAGNTAAQTALQNNLKLGYVAEGADGSAQTTTLTDGLNFKDTATVNAANGANGEVMFNVVNGSITSDHLGAGAVTSDKIAAGAVGNDKLAADAVTSDKIKDGAVTSNKIEAGAVGNDKLANDAVSTDKIQNGAITTDKIQDGAITGDKIDADSVTNKVAENLAGNTAAQTTLQNNLNLTYKDNNGTEKKVSLSKGLNFTDTATVSATTGADGLVSFAVKNGSITSDHLGAGAVTSDKIAADAVTSDKIKDGAVTSNKIEAGAVGNDKLANDAVSTDKIQNGAVTSDKINAGAVTEDKLANDAVTTDKIKDGAVTSNKIEAGAITEDKLANDAVTTDKIKDGAITGDKIDADSVTNKVAENLAGNKGAQEALQNNLNLTYKDNSGAEKKVSLSTGLNFTDTNTVAATTAADGVVSFEVKNGSITADHLAAGAVTTDKIVAGAVTNDKLANDAVSTDKIQNGAVTSDKINAGAVTEDKLANDAVTTDKVKDGAITSNKIEAGAITEDKLANDAVTTDKIKDGAVTGDKIDVSSVANALGKDPVAQGALQDNLELTYKDDQGAEQKVSLSKGLNFTDTATVDATATADGVVSFAVKNGSITSDHLGAGAVTSDKIAAGAVTGDKIEAGAVTEDKLANDAVTTDKIKNGAITEDKLANDAVSTDKIQNGAVTTDKIEAGAITEEKLATDSVTTDKIKDGAITGNKIDAGAITEDKLATDSVSTDKIQNGAITGDKIDADSVTNKVAENLAGNKTAQTTLQNNLNLTYKDDKGADQSVSLSKGLNFTDTATVDATAEADGVVKFDVKEGSITSNHLANGSVTGDKIDAPTVAEVIGKDPAAQATLQNNLKLAYKANGQNQTATPSISLNQGLNFVDGTRTVASIKENGEVTFDLNADTIDKIDNAATQEDLNKVNNAVANAPFEYQDKNGTKLAKGPDGKFYPVKADGSADTNQASVANEDVVVNQASDAPIQMGNVASSLGAKPNMTTEEAGNLVGGQNGLLNQTDPSALNKVATTGDLKAVAQSGLNFAGDVGTDIHKNLSETITIKGGIIDDAQLVDNNIGVVSDGTDNLVIKLAKELKGLTSIESIDAAGNTTVQNGNGVNITGNDGSGASFTKDGLTFTKADGTAGLTVNADGTITGLQDATTADGAVTKGQLDKGLAGVQGSIDAVKNSSLSFAGDNAVTIDKKLNETLEIVGGADKDKLSDNNIGVNAENGKLEVKLAEDLKGLSSVETIDKATGDKTVQSAAGLKTEDKNGNSATVNANGVTVTGNDGASASFNKDGLTFTKPDGSNGLSVNADGTITGLKDATTADGAVTKGQLDNALNGVQGNLTNDLNAIKQDGLNFGGDAGDTIHKNLSEKLELTGGETDESKLTTLADRNVGVISNDGKLEVRLAKELTGLTSVETVDSDGNKTVQNGSGVTVTDKAGNKNHVGAQGTTTTDKAGNTTVQNAQGITTTDKAGNSNHFGADGLIIKDKEGNKISITATGIDNGGKTLSGIEAGEISKDSKDAVNGSQLFAMSERMSDITRDLRAGIAGAAAMTMLDTPNEAGKSTVALGSAFYKGQGAIALGLSTRSDNGRWLVRGSMSYNTQSDAIVGAGVSYTW